jgi:hypothetical protein
MRESPAHPQETPGSAELRALRGTFLCAGLVDHSLPSSGQEAIGPAALIEFHGGQIGRFHPISYDPILIREMKADRPVRAIVIVAVDDGAMNTGTGQSDTPSAGRDIALPMASQKRSMKR